MKFYISYFYKVRFFDKYLLPLSTAVGDPKWYHDFQGKDHIFRDKHDVLVGYRINRLAPNFEAECIECDKSHPESCSFLKMYKKQLESLDFDQTIRICEKFAEKIKEEEELCETPDIVLLVHEAPDNPCSERWPLIEWFNEHGITLEEWNEKNYYGK